MKVAKLLCTIAILATVSGPSAAKDLFNDGRPIAFTQGAALETGTTVSGYPIYTGGDAWLLGDIKADSATTNDVAVTSGSRLGFVHLALVGPEGKWLASQFITVSTRPAGGETYANGSPCGGTHIVAVNRAGGKDDNCLVIDAKNFKSDAGVVTYFDVIVTQTRSGARRYIVHLALNAEPLGFGGTAPGDWNSADKLQASASRAAFMEKLKSWGSQLQMATDHILDYSKPQNVLDGLASIRTLASVPE